MSTRKQLQEELKKFRSHPNKKVAELANKNLRESNNNLEIRLNEIHKIIGNTDVNYVLIDAYYNYTSIRVIRRIPAATLEEFYTTIKKHVEQVIGDGILIEESNKLVRSATNPFITIWIEQLSGSDKGKMAPISIPHKFLTNYNTFETFLTDLINGDVHGSDSIDLNEREINLTIFDINIIEELQLQGPFELNYKCMFEKYEGQNCWFQVLEYLCNQQSTNPIMLKMILLQILFDGSINESINPESYFEKVKDQCLTPQDISFMFPIVNVIIHSNTRIVLSKEFLKKINDNVEYIRNRPLFKEMKKQKDWYHQLRVSDLGDDTITLSQNSNVIKYNGKLCTIGCIVDELRSKYLKDCDPIDILIDDFHVDVIVHVEMSNLCINDSYHFGIIREKTKGSNYVNPRAALWRSKYIKTSKFVMRQLPSSEVATRNEVFNLYEVGYIYFDYETIVDFKISNVMVPYSVSSLYISEFEYKKLIKHQEYIIEFESGNEKDHDKYLESVSYLSKIKNRTKCFIGYDCNKQFFDYYSKLAINKRLIFIGFNNSQYDNFILISWLKKTHPEWVTSIIYTNNSILNARLNLRHDFFDVRKHLNCASLKRLCQSFRVKYEKLEFNHYEAQQLHNKNELINYISNDDSLIEYNKMDVFCLALLMGRYEMALRNVEVFSWVSDITKIKTVGSLVYRTWTKDMNIQKINIPKFNKNQMWCYDDILEYKVAGRCELYNGKTTINKRHVSMDVCSMYPYALSVCDVYYPTGDIIEIKSENELKGRIGFLYCSIDQSNLWNTNKPLIYPKKTPTENIWNHEEILYNYFINTEEIAFLRKNGCKVITQGGIMFTDKIKGCNMFRIINDLMLAKGHQDNLKATKGPYNEALRETLKLTMNSLTGKVVERLHVDKIAEIKSIVEYKNLEQKQKNISAISTIGGTIMIQYKVAMAEVFHKHRPIFIASLIYTYSRRHLYEHVISRIPREELIYTDTDSVKMTYDAFIKWRDEYASQTPVPHWSEVQEIEPKYKNFPLVKMNGLKYEKVFGAFEDEHLELDEQYGAPNNYGVYFAKKCYFVGHKDMDNITIYKSKLKGVRGCDLYLPPDISIPSGLKELNDFYNTNPELHLSYKDNFHKLAVRVMNEEKVKVLCLSFQKSIRNTKKNVSLTNTAKHNHTTCNVLLNIRIKTISIK